MAHDMIHFIVYSVLHSVISLWCYTTPLLLVALFVSWSLIKKSTHESWCNFWIFSTLSIPCLEMGSLEYIISPLKSQSIGRSDYRGRKAQGSEAKKKSAHNFYRIRTRLVTRQRIIDKIPLYALVLVKECLRLCNTGTTHGNNRTILPSAIRLISSLAILSVRGGKYARSRWYFQEMYSLSRPSPWQNLNSSAWQVSQIHLHRSVVELEK